jgi:hypothetical protein
MWLDAADASTITESGGFVSQWNDKSGNDYHVSQGTGASQPALITAGLNGLSVIDFDGSNDFMRRTTATALGRNVSGLTIYLVRRVDVANATSAIIQISTSNAEAGRCLTNMASSRNTAGSRTLDGDTAQTVTGTIPIVTGWDIRTTVFVYSATDLFMFLNRAVDAENFSFQSATTTSDTNSARLTIGANTSGTPLNYFNGALAEILIYHDAHTAGQSQAVWQYLGSKWGLTI